jgi:hypothetical protein
MSSGARHGIGVVVGLIATPLIAGFLTYGVNRATVTVRVYAFDAPWSQRLIVAGALLVAAVALGLVAGSRLSPLASLIPGVAFTGLGLMWFLAPGFALRNTGRDFLTDDLFLGYTYLSPAGIWLLLGVALVTASLSPSRWRGAGASPAPSPYGMQAGPMGPGGAPPQPYGPPVGQYQPAPSPYAPGPASPHPPAPLPKRPVPEAAPQREQPGEWTQMYGGDEINSDKGGGPSGGKGRSDDGWEAP